jgi:hypothetical protein
MVPAVTVTWPAGGADVAVAAPCPVLVVPALRADEALWPAQLGQVVEAVLFAGEGGLELQAGLRKGLEYCPTVTQPAANSSPAKNQHLGVGGVKCIPQRIQLLANIAFINQPDLPF